MEIRLYVTVTIKNMEVQNIDVTDKYFKIYLTQNRINNKKCPLLFTMVTKSNLS